MCAVNIRGHEANFYEAEARCHEAEIAAEARKSEAEAEWFGLEAHVASTSLHEAGTMTVEQEFLGRFQRLGSHDLMRYIALLLLFLYPR